MPEKFGIDKTKPFVASVAKIASGVSSFFHGGGLLSLWPVVNEASSLRTTDFKGMADEAMDISNPEADQLEQAFDDNLSLANKDIEVDVKSCVALVKEAGEKVSEVYTVGAGYVAWGKDFYGRVKAVFVKAS